jgi:Leucine-rich repeat (LRR) protein
MAKNLKLSTAAQKSKPPTITPPVNSNKDKQVEKKDVDFDFVETYKYEKNRHVKLHFESRKFTNIKLDSFKNCRKVMSLSISKNILREIEENSFQHLKRLIYLDLSENKIGIIHPEAFIQLSLFEFKLKNELLNLF